MPKRVLGDDPFSPDGRGTEGQDEGAGASRPSKRPPAAEARTSKRPPAPGKSGAGASVRPPASKPPSKPAAGASRPSKRPPATETEREEEVVAKAPPVPSVPTVSVEEERAAAEETAAPVDLPPDLSRPEPVVSLAPPPHDVAVAEDAGASGGDVQAQIRSLEAQLDALLARAGGQGAERETLERVAEKLRARIDAGEAHETHGAEAAPEGEAGATADERARALAAESAPPLALRDEQSVFDVARELLSSDYYRKQWGRVAMRDRSEEVDDFGMDPKYAARWRPFFDFLYARWWRVEAHGIENVPAHGRVILCANHSGALPYDGAMLATALRREHPAQRELRWLAEDFVFHFPFLGVFMNRIGAVRASQENAERLLRKDACVGVFPEGVKGISKLYRDRYKLQRFGRGGHVKLAIRTRTPIVPVAVLGAEEANPLIAPSGLLAKAMGVPYFPITPTFPWLGPAGLVPLPSKWKIFFLEPIPMDGYGPEAAEDEVLVGRLNEKIRAQIQDELDRAVRERQSVFKG